MTIALDKQVIQGTDRHYRLTFTSEDLITEDNPEGRVDLTGATVYYRWKRNQDDPNPAEISKSSVVATEVEILAQTLDPYTMGQADPFLVPADTDSLLAGWHWWDAWAVLVSGKRHAKLPQKVYLVDAVTDLTSPSPSPTGGAGDNDDVAIVNRSYVLAHQQANALEYSLGRVPVGYSVVGLTAEVADAVSAGTVNVNVKLNSVTVLSVELDPATNPLYDLDEDLTGTHSLDETDTLVVELVVAGYENVGAAASTLEVNVALAREAVLGASAVTDLKTANYDAAFNEIIRCDTTVAGFDVNLPAITAGSASRSIKVKAAVGTPGDLINAITVIPDGTDTIDGEASFTIDRARTGLWLTSDGGDNWMIF